MATIHRCYHCGNVCSGGAVLETPTEFSPFQLVQELYRDDPWKLLVVCSILNKTRGSRAIQTLKLLFSKWPDARALAAADQETLASALTHVGLQNRRSRALILFSKDWLVLQVKHGDTPPWQAVDSLRGCGIGAYAIDCYQLFVDPKQIVTPTSGDPMLMQYCAWARGELRMVDDTLRAGA